MKTLIFQVNNFINKILILLILKISINNIAINIL